MALPTWSREADLQTELCNAQDEFWRVILGWWNASVIHTTSTINTYTTNTNTINTDTIYFQWTDPRTSIWTSACSKHSDDRVRRGGRWTTKEEKVGDPGRYKILLKSSDSTLSRNLTPPVHLVRIASNTRTKLRRHSVERNIVNRNRSSIVQCWPYFA